MYGVNYKPAAKKRRDRMSVNMNDIPAISSHMDNVATLANEPVDWKGYKTHFKFQHNQPPLNATATGSAETIDHMAKGKQFTNGSHANSYNQSQECSFDNPGNVDVALFHKVLEDEIGNLTSERMKALFTDERRRSIPCNERRQQYRNVHRSRQYYSQDGAAELGIHNNGYVKEWIGGNAGNVFTSHEKQGRSLPRNRNRYWNHSQNIGSLYSHHESLDYDTMDRRGEYSIHDDSCIHGHNGNIRSEDDVDLSSVNTHTYERAQQQREQIAKYCMNATACTFGKQVCEVNSPSNDSGCEDDCKDVVQYETTSEGEIIRNGETEEQCISRSQCQRNTDSVDNANQHIAIPIEDPRTYGSRNGRANEHCSVKKSNPARIYERCYSTEVNTREKVHQKLPRKYSMC